MTETKQAAGSYKLDDGSIIRLSAEDAKCLNDMLAKSSYAKQFKSSLMKSKADFDAALKMAKTLKENTQVSRTYRDVLAEISTELAVRAGKRAASKSLAYSVYAAQSGGAKRQASNDAKATKHQNQMARIAGHLRKRGEHKASDEILTHATKREMEVDTGFESTQGQYRGHRKWKELGGKNRPTIK